ncbi:MAG: siphovirus ReqiPepy6 Gp37-like family protein [Lachnospiraceae bacterium]|nr:siphovirus ReqiPepy6 Gp37-like family protein [Lachnospiraceae bacterium]
MEIFVLNKNFEIIDIIDYYKSLEWVKRYCDTGDFVLNINANAHTVQILKEKNYIVREDDEKIYQIEKINLKSNEEDGDILTVSGRSIEKILAQRIVWKQTSVGGGETAEDFIRRIITENAINPSDKKRKIPRLKLGEKMGFSEKIEKQLTGDNLLTAVKEICNTYSYGFKIVMNEAGELVFKLYKGKDRSYRQNENPFVIFSPDFDNVVNTEYEYDETNISNVALIGGEGEGNERKFQNLGDTEGMERYELFVDAKDVSSNNGEISTSEYNNMLLERGREKIAENTFIETYDGELENTNTYIYKEDYDIGDVVQIVDKFGIESTPRILEIIESDNENGYKIVATYGSWEVI